MSALGQKKKNDSLYSNSSSKNIEGKTVCYRNYPSEDEEEQFDCGFCTKKFDTEHGRNIHVGKVHRINEKKRYYIIIIHIMVNSY